MRKLIRPAWIFPALAVMMPLLAFACDAGEPEELTFELEVRERSLAQGNAVLQAKQGDMVTIVVSADEPVAFHLHGYDIEEMAKPEGPATLSFTANATGSFPFTIHAGQGQEHVHGAEGSACAAAVPAGAALPAVRVTASPAEEHGQVHVAVELDNFALGHAPAGTLAGHWHLYVDGDIAGMFMEPSATVPVEEAGEHRLMVVLSDPHHCEYDARAMTVVTVEEGRPGGMDHETNAGDEEGGPGEVELGRLEVHPR